MKKTRRHKYLQISVFFLIYSIIHVMSNENTENTSNTSSTSVVVNTDIKPKEPQNSVDEQKEINDNISMFTIQKRNGNSPIKQILQDKNAENSTEHKKNSTKVGLNHLHHGLRDLLLHHADIAQNSSNSTNQEENGKGLNNTHDTVHAMQNSSNSTMREENGNATKGLNNINDTLHATVVPQVTKVAQNSSNSTKQDEIGNAKNETNIHGSLHGTVIHHVMNLANSTDSDCIPAAIGQFPSAHMSLDTMRKGGLIIHVLVAVYMFLGLAIVCDEYFVASLDRICEELKMSPDVAGATFMAAGSSAPELATVVIGVFLAQDDIGISGVIGSAVFNIMFVIACCGLVSTAVIYLNWWPLIRDSFFYAVSILVMLGVIKDGYVTWVESVIMLVTYLIYCVALHYNTFLESVAYSLPVPFRHTPPSEQSGLVSYKTLDDTGPVPNYGMDWSPDRQQRNGEQDAVNFGSEWSPEKNQAGFANQLSGPDLNQATIEASPQQPAPPQQSKPIQQDYYKPKEYDPSTQVNPLTKPEGGFYAIFSWAMVYPIHWLCRLTMPDCRSDKYKNWYPYTFFISMLWISFYSYFMVWMITIIGFALSIPDTVMGLTFVAAGVSVPDALSSIAVIKEGYGDMAVSNAIGSNVFDILVCLGLPWFLKTAITNPGSMVKVKSRGVTYSTLSLLSTVVFFVVATHMNGWKLDRRYGIILMIWYLIFIAFASLYEFLSYDQCPFDATNL